MIFDPMTHVIKGHVDSKVSKAGDTMTGKLTITVGEESPLAVNYTHKTDGIILKRSTVPIDSEIDGMWFGGNIRIDDSADVTYGRIATYKYAVNNVMSLSAYRNGVESTIDVRVDDDGKKWANAPTPSSASDDSTKIATTEWVNNKDNDVVHKSQNEAISGAKEFTGNLVQSGKFVTFGLKNTVLVKSEIPSEMRYSRVQFWDSNNAVLGAVGCWSDTNGLRRSSLRVYKDSSDPNSSGYGEALIEAVYDINNNTFYATAPATRSTGYGSTDIATAGWVRSRITETSDTLNQRITDTSNTLNQKITDLSNLVGTGTGGESGGTSLTSLLFQEIDDREAGDSALDQKITSSVSQLTSADTALGNRVTTVENSIAGLGTASGYDVGTGEGNIPLLVTGGKLPASTIPSLALSEFMGTVTFAKDLEKLSTAEMGDFATVTKDPGNNGTYILTGAYSNLDNWKKLAGPDVTWADIVGEISDNTDLEGRLSGIETSVDKKVSKDGDVAETITGIKSFIAGLHLNAGGNATLTGGIWSTGHAYADLNAINANGVYATVRVRSDADGTTYVTAPTPSSAKDSSTKIATTEWVNDIDNDIVHKSRGETISGRKTFTNGITLASDSAKVIGFRSTTESSDAGYISYSGDNMWIKSTYGNVTLESSKGTTCANTTPDGANGKEIVTAGWANSKYVYKKGDTMTGNLGINSDNPALYFRPSARTYADIVQYDTQGARKVILRMDADDTSTGLRTWSIGVTKPGTNTFTTVMKAGYDGTGYSINGVTPALDSNSGELATTEWVHRCPALVHQTGNEEIAGAKKFLGNPAIKHSKRSLGVVTDDASSDIAGLYFLDKDSLRVAGIENVLTPEGTNEIVFVLRNPDNSTWKRLHMYSFTDGTYLTQIDMDTKINGNVTVRGDSPSIFQANTGYTNGTAPTSDRYWVHSRSMDNSNKPVSSIETRVTTGQHRVVQIATVTTNREWKYPLTIDMAPDASDYLVRCASSPQYNEKGERYDDLRILNAAMLTTDNSVVHTTGNEEISGTKTFTGIHNVAANWSSLNLKSSILRQDSTFPSSTVQSNISLVGMAKDEDGNDTDSTIWMLVTNQTTTGLKNISFTTNFKRENDSADYWKYPLKIEEQDDHSLIVRTVATKSDATSNEIATAGWAHSKFVNIAGSTMTGNLVIEKSAPRLVLKHNAHDLASATEAYVDLSKIQILDKENHGMCELRYDRDLTYSRFFISVAESNNGTIASKRFDFIHNAGAKGLLKLPDSPDANQNSLYVATTAWVHSASCVVHRTGNETIAGVKTFQERPSVTRALNSGYICKSTSFDISATHTAWVRPFQIASYDKNDKYITLYQAIANADNSRHMTIALYDSNGEHSDLMIIIDETNKTSYATAPTPPATSVNNEIVTAEWFRNRVTVSMSAPTGGVDGDIWLVPGDVIEGADAGVISMGTEDMTPGVTQMANGAVYFMYE